MSLHFFLGKQVELSVVRLRRVMLKITQTLLME